MMRNPYKYKILNFLLLKYFSQKLVIVLQKSGIKRKEEELGKLYHIIKHNNLFMEFFNEMPEEASINLLTSFRHLSLLKGQEVFKYGS